ncbi:MAG: hypothetical protein R3D31_03630 [Hyphomicrobiaceae bacterium]
MARRNHWLRRVALTVLALGLVWPHAAEAALLKDLTGRWSGVGTVTYNSGSTERLRCVATYSVSGGTRLRQNLRCVIGGGGDGFHVTGAMNARGSRLSGSWSELTRSASGSVSGRFGGSGMQLAISGDLFSASMAVQVNGCRQSVNISWNGLNIRRISIGLRKC